MSAVGTVGTVSFPMDTPLRGGLSSLFVPHKAALADPRACVCRTV